MLAIAYRPTWAGPVAEVDEWNPEKLEQLPAGLRHLFGSRNQRRWEFHGGNKPEGMAREAPGMNASRWDRTSARRATP